MASEQFLERDMVAGLEKGLAVVEAFDETRPRLSVTEAAELTGLSRAAARRYLLTLTRLGCVHFDGKHFTLTPRILRLGYAYLSSSLPARVQPSLERLSRETGESCSAAILDGDEIVYVARVATRRIMSIGLSVGTRLLAWCTSLGRVLLAFGDPAGLERVLAQAPFPPRTPLTRTSADDLRAVFDRVRRDGHALVDEELEVGLQSLAVPVFDARDRLVCALNVGAPALSVSADEMLERMLPLLRAAGDDLRAIV